MLYTVMISASGGETFTAQVERDDERQALVYAVGLWRPSDRTVLVESIGADVQDLPVPAIDALRITPMNGLRNVWYFYGAPGEDMIHGQIVATA